MTAQTASSNKTSATSKTTPATIEAAKNSKLFKFSKKIQVSKVARTMLVSITTIMLYYYFKSIKDFRDLAKEDGNVSLRYFSDLLYVILALLLSVGLKYVFDSIFKGTIVRMVKA
jgi:hypothetical protein